MSLDDLERPLHTLLRSVSYFVSNRALTVGTVYGVTTAMSVSVIRDTVWDFFFARKML